MAARTGILACVRRPADGGEPPNRYVPAITAEVRVHWPPRATPDEIHAALEDAVQRARAEVDNRLGRDMRYPEGRPTWLGEYQTWPCRRCSKDVDDAGPHDCRAGP